jgi:hypothetical protein
MNSYFRASHATIARDVPARRAFDARAPSASSSGECTRKLQRPRPSSILSPSPGNYRITGARTPTERAPINENTNPPKSRPLASRSPSPPPPNISTNTISVFLLGSGSFNRAAGYCFRLDCAADAKRKSKERTPLTHLISELHMHEC